MKGGLRPELVILARGVADRAQDLLQGQTPLEYAATPNLDRLSRRGQLQPFDTTPSGHSVHAAGDLFTAFGVPITAHTDPPVAAVVWLGSGHRPEGRGYIHADPVTYVINPDSVLLMDPEELELELTEAEALITTLNQELFLAQGRKLCWISPTSWILQLPEPPALLTEPPEAWIGGNAQAGLPQGEASREWRRHLSEAQLLLASTPVNRRRQARGEPQINSLWLWGSGRLPTEATGSWGGVWGTGPLLAGLAQLSGSPYYGPPSDLEAVLEELQGQGRPPHPGLITLDEPRSLSARGNLGAKIEAIEALDREWFASAVTALTTGELGGLWLVLGPEAPTGSRPPEPPPPAPLLQCRPGRRLLTSEIWPWHRNRQVSERGLKGPVSHWTEISHPRDR